MKVSCHTLGCRVNAYDTYKIMEELKSKGYETTDCDSDADVILINTCAVTNESERKSRQLIRKVKAANPNAVVLVSGCYSQIDKKGVQNLSAADIITGTSDREDIPRLLDEHFGKVPSGKENERKLPVFFEGRSRAIVKIQDGCRMFCAFCIIPYARKQMCCADSGEVIEQIKEIASHGYSEVVLTGIHLSSYKDGKGVNLIDLTKEISSQTDIKRIRYGSLEPRLLTHDFLVRLTKVKKFCPGFHISLQSGSDRILSLMNRRYTTKEYFETVKRVKTLIPDALITTDVIVGFPGETESDFLETVKFVEKVGFEHVHIFPYSPKKGTPAADMQPQIINAEKKRRAEILAKVSDEVGRTVRKSFVGKEAEVLVEKKNECGYWEGFSENYMKVFVKSDKDLSRETVKVCLTDAVERHMFGEFV